ncbi:hypothetical protein [Roseibaca sp. Y0-43]|uniref:hypothetical protein n=1 Tax=Roseibaca sp. Y0-43 TaxID=2816854 RepID=UPI001D0CD2C7|nr:hypothetical protein [Roseibaca sp. Y0-43]MCC1481576.1 hypothetical protein [Roseibaca sp. Y0-43]
MPDSLAALYATWRIVKAKPRQIWRLVLPPFLLAMAFKAWLGVQVTGHVWPELPGYDLVLRGTLGLALAVMALLWHRAIYFGPRAPLTVLLALGYWGQGAILSVVAALPFVPLVLGFEGGTAPAAAIYLSVFVADALSLWLVLVFGVVCARRAGGETFGWRAAWASAPRASLAFLALLLALALHAQGALVAALTPLHSGAAFLLDSAVSFALIGTVLTLMARPKLG